MSLSSCPHCWETPCICGKNWSHVSDKDVTLLFKTLMNNRPKVREEFMYHPSDTSEKRYIETPIETCKYCHRTPCACSTNFDSLPDDILADIARSILRERPSIQSHIIHEVPINISNDMMEYTSIFLSEGISSIGDMISINKHTGTELLPGQHHTIGKHYLFLL